MEAVGKWLLVLAIVGGAALLLSRLGGEPLPRDIVIHGKNVTFFRRNGIGYGIGAIPLGGYVRIPS
jgi:membrane-associated protease RseP (regulator of RpoE activity)